MGLNRKQQKKFFILGLIGVVALCIFLATYFGETSPVLVEGRIEIAPELESRAAGMRTVYVILHDVDSQMPMPWGAHQLHLRRDAKGQFTTFLMTKDNVQMMPAAQANPNPRAFRLKVRLDADGLGGADTPGDIVGEATSVAPGTKNIVITLNRVVGS